MKINIKNWNYTDNINYSTFYFSSINNGKYWASIIFPQSSNDYKFILRITLSKNFDRWIYADIEEEFREFIDLIKYMEDFDITKNLEENKK